MSKPSAKAGARVVTSRDLFATPFNFLAFGFGSGLAPKAPGTFGTLAAVPLCYLLDRAGATIYLLATLLALGIGIAICAAAARHLESHDHPAIVWDEIAGFLVTMLVVPVTPLTLFAGFLLFRLFDILKPWPIRRVDRQVHGGLGIMLDDLLAAVMAGALLFLLARSGLIGGLASLS